MIRQTFKVTVTLIFSTLVYYHWWEGSLCVNVMIDCSPSVIRKYGDCRNFLKLSSNQLRNAEDEIDPEIFDPSSSFDSSTWSVSSSGMRSPMTSLKTGMIITDPASQGTLWSFPLGVSNGHWSGHWNGMIQVYSSSKVNARKYSHLWCLLLPKMLDQLPFFSSWNAMWTSFAQKDFPSTRLLRKEGKKWHTSMQLSDYSNFWVEQRVKARVCPWAVLVQLLSPTVTMNYTLWWKRQTGKLSNFHVLQACCFASFC